jgi:hypothetical protein
MKTLPWTFPILLCACTSNSGVVPAGPDTYLVSRQAATGFSGMGTLKADALREANQYCLSQTRLLKVLNTSESRPPYILGNYPKADVEFQCLKDGDSRLQESR